MPGRIGLTTRYRLDALRARHPGITVREGPFGTWDAEIPAGGNSVRYLAAYDPDELLDRIGQVTGEAV